MAKRWRPPPMNEGSAGSAGAPSSGSSATPKLTVDEKVVRKMLQVNPALRDGRTTAQVKRDIESGQAVPAAGRRPTGAPSMDAPSPASSATPATNGPRGELDETLGLFMRGKAMDLQGRLDDIAGRRKQLEVEEQQVRATFCDELARFVAMLDPTVVATHGVAALSRHKAVLERFGVTPAEVLEAVRRARGSGGRS